MNACVHGCQSFGPLPADQLDEDPSFAMIATSLISHYPLPFRHNSVISLIMVTLCLVQKQNIINLSLRIFVNEHLCSRTRIIWSLPADQLDGDPSFAMIPTPLISHYQLPLRHNSVVSLIMATFLSMNACVYGCQSFGLPTCRPVG
jgi:hypothetical protein